MTPIEPNRIEVMDDRVAEILRRKTPAESMRLAEQLFIEGRNLVRDWIRAQHPEWNEHQIRRAVIEHLHGST